MYEKLNNDNLHQQKRRKVQMAIVLNSSNGDIPFPLEFVKSNKVLLTLLCDIYGLSDETFETLEEAVKADLEENPNKHHDIPMQEWDARLIHYLLEFAQYHHFVTPLVVTNDELPIWDREFLFRIENVDPELCGYLFQFANYLHNDDLIEICAIYFANKITGHTKDEVRREFGIKNDFTEEEEQEIEQKIAWIKQHK